MPNETLDTIAGHVAELDARAAKSQDDARRTLNPLFQRGDDRKQGPKDFVESSYLYMRSCDADAGSRPIPCPVFWVSPDLRIAPLSNLGAPTRELRAGDAYRLTATVRNRGDLMVPSAKVEFWLVNPSLGFDVRFATKVGVAAGRVQAHGASEVSLDYVVPPAVSGHRCLFARVFSFSPLDIPLDDYALDPLIDRHVAQLNLNIVAQAQTLLLDWVHLRNAAERLEIVPMTTAGKKALRLETMAPLTLASSTRSRELVGAIGMDLIPARDERVRITVERTALGFDLHSVADGAAAIDERLALRKQAQEALQGLERGRGQMRQFAKLFASYRATTAQSVRSQVRLAIPDMKLKTTQGIALQIQRRDIATRQVVGGIALVVTG